MAQIIEKSWHQWDIA